MVASGFGATSPWATSSGTKVRTNVTQVSAEQVYGDLNCVIWTLTSILIAHTQERELLW